LQAVKMKSISVNESKYWTKHITADLLEKSKELYFNTNCRNCSRTSD
jgi:hypothetical protein